MLQGESDQAPILVLDRLGGVLFRSGIICVRGKYGVYRALNWVIVYGQ